MKGCAGLGNRLYTLSQAISYAEKSGRTLLIDWRDGQFDGHGENAFTKFFALKKIAYENVEDVDFSSVRSVYPKVWKGLLDKNVYDSFEQDSVALTYLPFRFQKFFKKISFKAGYWKHLDNGKAGGIMNLLSTKNFVRGEYLPKYRKEDVVVFVDFSPPPKEKIIQENIMLNEQVLAKIDRFVEEKGLDKNTIGIHIRYTDKKPDSSFDKLYEEIEKVYKSGMNLFLATDNKAIIDMFQSKYGNVILYPKYLPDEQNEGLHQWALYNKQEDLKATMFEESIIDMWLLARCEYLIYQKNSSFSNISKILKDDNKISFW